MINEECFQFDWFEDEESQWQEEFESECPLKKFVVKGLSVKAETRILVDSSKLVEPSVWPEVISDSGLVVSADVSTLDVATTRALRKAGVKDIIVDQLSPATRRISIELNDAKEIELNPVCGCTKIALANKLSGQLSAREDGAIVVENIKGLTAKIPRITDGLPSDVKVTKIVLSYGREGKPILEVTGLHVGISRTLEIALPEESVGSLERLSLLLAASDRKTPPGGKQEFNQSIDNNNIAVRLLIALCVLTCVAVGGPYAVEPSAQPANYDKVSGEPQRPDPLEFRPGEKLAISGGGAEVVYFDQTQQRVLIKDITPVKAGAGEPLTFTPEQLAKDYGRISFEGKEYIFHTGSGKVFAPTGDGRFTAMHDYWALTPKEIRGEVLQGKADQLFKAITGGSIPGYERPRFNDTSGSPRNVTGVRVETAGAYYRNYRADGKDIVLVSRDRGAWFYGPDFKDSKGRTVEPGNVKVHVIALNPADLAAVQAKLLPELLRATAVGGPLEGRIATFKTHDPMIGVEEEWARRVPWNEKAGNEPFTIGSRGQRAKAFTIYAPDAKSAREIQLYLDNLLKKNGLVLNGIVDTGNVGDASLIKEGSNRVTLEQDHFEPGRDAAGTKGYKLSPTLNDAVTEYVLRRAAEWGYADVSAMFIDQQNRELKPEVLQQLERELHLDGDNCKLTYASEPGSTTGRRLMIVDAAGEAKYAASGYMLEGNKVPVLENGKLKTGVSGRGAMYHISDIAGRKLQLDLDPARLQLNKPEPGAEIRVNGENCRVIAEAGRYLVVGRSGTNSFTAAPISAAELSTGYEAVKFVVDGKETIRYCEKARPESGLFVVRVVAGQTFIGAEGSLSLVPAEVVSTLPSVSRIEPGTTAPAKLDAPAVVKSRVEPVRPAPLPPPAPTIDKFQATEVKFAGDGTLTRDEIRIGESMSPERLKEQKELSAEQIKFLETLAERLKNTGKPEDLKQAAELKVTIRILKGDFGLDARDAAHREIIEDARKHGEATRGRGVALGPAVGLGILLTAALGWYACQRRVPTSSLNRAITTGK